MKISITAHGADRRECINNARSILERIRFQSRPGSFVPAPFEPDYNEYDIPSAPVSADDWQEFKRKFVESIGNEKIQPTGMTHSEFIQYIDSSGWRDGDEYKSISKSKASTKSFRQVLKDTGWNDEEDDDPEFKRLFE